MALARHYRPYPRTPGEDHLNPNLPEHEEKFYQARSGHSRSEIPLGVSAGEPQASGSATLRSHARSGSGLSQFLEVPRSLTRQTTFEPALPTLAPWRRYRPYLRNPGKEDLNPYLREHEEESYRARSGHSQAAREPQASGSATTISHARSGSGLSQFLEVPRSLTRQTTFESPLPTLAPWRRYRPYLRNPGKEDLNPYLREHEEESYRARSGHSQAAREPQASGSATTISHARSRSGLSQFLEVSQCVVLRNESPPSAPCLHWHRGGATGHISGTPVKRTSTHTCANTKRSSTELARIAPAPNFLWA
jgi:hypothetical protein